jgi:hypothetical protein
LERQNRFKPLLSKATQILVPLSFNASIDKIMGIV